MIRSFRISFFSTLTAALALSAAPAQAIVGSAAPAPGDVAAHVVMVLNSEDGSAGFCTGVVIAPDVVLTAAHCVPKGAGLRIHFPSDGDKPVMLPVVAVARHPDYHADAIKTRERSIDLALVRLKATLPDRFTPATLARSAGAKVGSQFVIAGYGLGREGQPSTSGQLRSAKLVTRAPVSDVLLWSEDPAKAGTGACTGDSGGPVMAEGRAEISALVLWSAGQGSHQCGDLTQSLWLSPHRGWIDRVLQAWGSGPGL